MTTLSDITYCDAIEAVMKANNYYAPLKLLYKEIWKYKDKSKIVGKTPEMTIQERVQRDKRFIRIGLGVYALKDKLDLLPKAVVPKNEKEKRENLHSSIQGMLLEIGNIRK
ncbi:MAG: winged helix-turn-helix domain-containing protein, partial [Endomicrobium sp.]|nr:winged helix-turn-helix domain-containing protein [Endomicrobium sp.]